MWIELLKKANIKETPLSIYLDVEMFMSLPCYVDGTRIMKETGFVYTVEKMSVEKLNEVVDSFKEVHAWP
jgi:hypothetical protein